MGVFIKIVSNANFWTALIAIAGVFGSAFGLPQASVEQITGIISAASVLIASIIGYNIQKVVTIKAQAQVETAKVSR